MCSTPVEVSAARARWLGELGEALEETQRLLGRLNLTGEQRTAGVELFLRIEAARLEVRSLRLSRQTRSNGDPQWSNLAPWKDEDRSSA